MHFLCNSLIFSRNYFWLFLCIRDVVLRIIDSTKNSSHHTRIIYYIKERVCARLQEEPGDEEWGRSPKKNKRK